MVKVKDEPVGISNFLPEAETESDEDTFTILLATDIHLGHKKDDLIRCQD